MVIKDNSVEQINIALMSIDEMIKALDIEKMKAELDAHLKKLTLQLNNVRNGLQNGEDYNINIYGNAETADYAKDVDIGGVYKVDRGDVCIMVDSYLGDIGDIISLGGYRWKRIKREEFLQSPWSTQLVTYGWFVRVPQ